MLWDTGWYQCSGADHVGSALYLGQADSSMVHTTQSHKVHPMEARSRSW